MVLWGESEAPNSLRRIAHDAGLDFGVPAQACQRWRIGQGRHDSGEGAYVLVLTGKSEEVCAARSLHVRIAGVCLQRSNDRAHRLVLVSGHLRLCHAPVTIPEFIASVENQD